MGAFPGEPPRWSRVSRIRCRSRSAEAHTTLAQLAEPPCEEQAGHAEDDRPDPDQPDERQQARARRHGEVDPEQDRADPADRRPELALDLLPESYGPVNLERADDDRPGGDDVE